MATDNVAKMTPEQLRDELSAERRIAMSWYSEATERKHELALARDELAQSHIELRQIRKLWLNPAGATQIRAELTDVCATRDALSKALTGANDLNKEWYDLVRKRDVELAQARQKLKDLQGANRALAGQVDDVTANSKYWYKEAQDAEAERDKTRQEAQEQSDLAQRDWLSPCQKAGLENLVETLRRKLRHDEELSNYWLREHDVLEKRLTTLDAAEAALADCGIDVIYTEFNDNLPDAIQQMSKYIRELTVLLADARLAARTREPIIDLECQAVHTERQLRQKAEQRAERAEALAQLVNEGTVALLEHMAQANVDVYDAHKASELARQIREALDDNQA